MLGILMLVGVVLTGCTSQATSRFDRWYEDYAQTAAACADRAQTYAGRQTPQEVTNRCLASKGLSSHPQELPPLP